MGFGCAHALQYQKHCGHHVANPQVGNPLEGDPDTDSEIGDAETCFDDFRYGADFWKFPATARDSA